ncbi:spinocerebellar ataxia type 10 protein domain-containing protein [Syncephalis fuscata]|nr:spinocerebellar ataxia type 10 protein domain-containing protein [Syncephalis fuscata]
MINSIYRQIAQWSINTLKSNSASIESKTSSTSSMPVMSFDDHCTCLLLLLQILIHQSLVQQENISRLEQLLSCTVELLAVTERAIPRTTAVSNNTATSPTNLASVNLDGFNCVKRDTVRLLGNLAHQQPTVQDQIRELGGLALVLGQCSIDDRNPFVREYAIMAIRCLLEGNDTNQYLVAQMAPIAASQHPALAEAGFKVALDDNGKPQLQKLER